MEHDSHEKPILFISDLHLDPVRPAITELFLRFLEEEAQRCQALYILGDLFEAWIGDDAVTGEEPALAGMRRVADAGVPVRVMRGNRDFLLGPRFADLCGAELLPDPTVIRIDDEPVLLMHGDSLCTDDIEYQKFRATVREPQWQRWFLSLPIAERVEYAQRARSESGERNQAIDDYLMDVNADAVEAAMNQYAVRRLVHGHTHRPAVHQLKLGGLDGQRIVLGDWYDQGSVLRWRDGAPHLQVLPLE
ncbi:MAG: UDP-2,3-diacylglucosamine diphosphatase [Ectothiorhodospiraceae bacterium]|jgi:UDP-2,3-diacylglucosamine hydrolase